MVADTAPLIPHARQRLNPRERRELGKTRRKQLPRSLLAEYAAAADRPDPVALLETQARTRVADLMPIRYGRMLASPFSFYRGSALLMASDLAAGTHTGLQVQLCGDAHLSNFGMFASPERNLTFDVNDFDETLPGPWEWDVKRLLTSLTVAGRDNGFDAATCEYVTLAAAEGYRQRMLQLAQMGELELWYSHTYVNEALGQRRPFLRSPNSPRGRQGAVTRPAAGARTVDPCRRHASAIGQ